GGGGSLCPPCGGRRKAAWNCSSTGLVYSGAGWVSRACRVRSSSLPVNWRTAWRMRLRSVSSVARCARRAPWRTASSGPAVGGSRNTSKGFSDIVHLRRIDWLAHFGQQLADVAVARVEPEGLAVQGLLAGPIDLHEAA